MKHGSDKSSAKENDINKDGKSIDTIADLNITYRVISIWDLILLQLNIRKFYAT